MSEIGIGSHFFVMIQIAPSTMANPGANEIYLYLQSFNLNRFDFLSGTSGSFWAILLKYFISSRYNAASMLSAFFQICFLYDCIPAMFDPVEAIPKHKRLWRLAFIPPLIWLQLDIHFGDQHLLVRDVMVIGKNEGAIVIYCFPVLGRKATIHLEEIVQFRSDGL